MHAHHYLATLASVAAVGGSLAASTTFAKSAVATSTTDAPAHVRQWGGSHTPLTPAQLQAKLQTRLDAAVKAGTLTQAQEGAALTEASSVEQQMTQIKALPKDQRVAAFKSLHDSVASWATQNGIDIKNVLGMNRHHAMSHGNPPAGK